MKKTGIKPAKIGALFLVAVMAMAAVGASYAHWQEILTISGVMTTDDIHPMFDGVLSNDDPGDPVNLQMDPDGCGVWDMSTGTPVWDPNNEVGRRDKNVGNTDIYTTNNDQTLNIVINDAYPCYYSHVFYTIINKGSCPVLIHSPLMLETLSIQLDPTDPSTYYPIDIDDMMLSIGIWYYVDIYEDGGWQATITTDDGGHPELFDFSMMPTGSEDVHTVDYQLDPWDWKHGTGGDTTGQHMQNPDKYNDQLACDLCIHFENDCLENVVYDFNFGMTFWNWPEVTVVPPTNLPPVANAGGPYSGEVNDVITFDGSGSSDSDGIIVSYEWDMDEDGQYDDATGVTTTHSWSTPGDYQVGLKVTDDDGATDTDTTTVTITGFSDNFNDNSLDTAKWTSDVTGSSNSYEETNQEAKFNINTAGHVYLNSRELDLTGWNTITIEGKWKYVKPTGPRTAEMNFYFFDWYDNTKYVGIAYDNWNVLMRCHYAGSTYYPTSRSSPSSYATFKFVITKTAVTYYENGVSVMSRPSTILSTQTHFRFRIGGWDYSSINGQDVFFDDIVVTATG